MCHATVLAPAAALLLTSCVPPAGFRHEAAPEVTVVGLGARARLDALSSSRTWT